jgi:plasmid stabilization system protein ParE
MISIFWSPRAKQDFLEIYDFIFVDNPSAAEEFENQIYLKIERLIKFPKIGRIVPEINTPLGIPSAVEICFLPTELED